MYAESIINHELIAVFYREGYLPYRVHFSNFFPLLEYNTLEAMLLMYYEKIKKEGDFYGRKLCTP